MNDRFKTYLFLALIPIVALLLYLRHTADQIHQIPVVAERSADLRSGWRQTDRKNGQR